MSRYFLLDDLPVLPGIFICLSTMIVVSIVSLYARRLKQRNGELARNRHEMSQLYEKVLLAEKDRRVPGQSRRADRPAQRAPAARLARRALRRGWGAPEGGLALIKVENLKGINSIFGSQVGDSVVQRIALRLRAYAEQHACHAARVQKRDVRAVFRIRRQLTRSCSSCSEVWICLPTKANPVRRCTCVLLLTCRPVIKKNIYSPI